MRAAVQVPLRASVFNPAAVVRPISSRSSSFSLFSTSPSSRCISVSAAPWTCSRCLRQRTSTFARSYSTDHSPKSQKHGDGGKTDSKGSRRRVIRIAAAGGAVGTATLAFSDDIKHAYAAAARTGRVVVALAVCINE